MFMPSHLNHLGQLLILGVNEDYLYGGMLLLSILLLYICIKPVIIWLIRQNAKAALAYLISSLSVLVLLFGAGNLMSLTPLEGDAIYGLKVTLQWLGVSGALIMVINIYKQVTGKQKRST